MSAPRITNDINYWRKKGKSGKDVCIITHDDLDGITSAILMKNYLQKHGFTIKQYGVINYQEGWRAFKLDPKLITIALDFAEDFPGCDVYIDHHGKFSEELTQTQKNHSVKTSTGSAAEGIADQLGVPMSSDFKNWIDMIDSAKYDDYDVDIKSILNFDLKTIVSNPNAKMNFAASMNQLLKRSDHKTFVEVINACEYPSIYNIFRLFKIFYSRNNPDWKSGNEPEFVDDAHVRLASMKDRTRGQGLEIQGFEEDGTKMRFMSQEDFWNAFAQNLEYLEVDDDNLPIQRAPGEPPAYKWQVKPGVYQIIGNLMYVPSGTWANALRAKAIFAQDVVAGILPNDPKLNFVLLQYGNTLQIADLTTKIKDMDDDDLPKDIKGDPINNLGKYMEGLVKNFELYFGYKDDRTVAGGHLGIGSISNIFSKCPKKGYEGIKYLDLFKNKIINDLSGIKWGITMPWNEIDEANKKVPPEEINKKLVDIEDIRTEEQATLERDERSILNYLIINHVGKTSAERRRISKLFKDKTIKKIYEIWLETGFDEIMSGDIKPEDLPAVYFKRNRKIEDSELFNKIVDKFDLDMIYDPEAFIARGKQRKELKRILKIMLNIMTLHSYIRKDTEKKVKKFLKK